MIYPITIDDLLQRGGLLPLVDVRTPAEFAQGHIPGACNLPLFNNEERVQVGTTYKQVGREAAILLGFDLTGNKWSGFIRQALELAPGRKIALHCWRGGMRSGAMAWAFDMYGFDVYLLQGGYKSYRRHILQQFENPYRFRVIGGMTGSGKTRILHQLHLMGEQVVDLEELAQHRGSSYGTLNRMTQPTQEQFENNLGKELLSLDVRRPLWVEDESISIGKRFIPKPFWDRMQQAILLDLQVRREQRIQSLLTEYGTLDQDFLIECTERIRKRLGPEQTRDAIAAIREGRLEEFMRLLLVYYDKTYLKGLQKRGNTGIFPVGIEGTNDHHHAQQIVSFVLAMAPEDV